MRQRDGQCSLWLQHRHRRSNFINYDYLLHDCNPITIGDEVQIATRLHIYTATYPLEAKARRTVIEYDIQLAASLLLSGVRIL